MPRMSRVFHKVVPAACELDRAVCFLEQKRITKMSQANQSAALFSSGTFSWARIRQMGFSIADQEFSVGGMFLVNVALARTQTK